MEKEFTFIIRLVRNFQGNYFENRKEPTKELKVKRETFNFKFQTFNLDFVAI